MIMIWLRLIGRVLRYPPDYQWAYMLFQLEIMELELKRLLEDLNR